MGLGTGMKGDGFDWRRWFRREKKALGWPDGGRVGTVQGLISGVRLSDLGGISAEEASRNSVVMACVHWAMRTFPEPDVVLEERTAAGWRRVEDHAALAVVRRPHGQLGEPSKMSGRQMLQGVVRGLMLFGNAYLHKVRRMDGVVIGLDWLPSEAVEPVVTQGRLTEYRVRMGGAEERLAVEDVIHLMEGVDAERPWMGVSPLAAVRSEIRTDNEIAAYQLAILRAPSPGLLITPRHPEDAGAVTEAFVSETKRLVQQATTGANAGGVVFPSVPLDVQTLGFSPEQMSLEQMPKLPEERITAVLGIPAITVGVGAGLDRATYANFREAREAAVESFLVPKWGLVADALTEQLLPDLGLEVGRYRLGFDMATVRALSEDEASRHARIRADVAAGLLTADEGRVALGLTEVV